MTTFNWQTASHDERIEWLSVQQNKLLARIAGALETMAIANLPKEPSYRKDIGEYARFDWDSIGAVVLGQDDYGVTLVEWGGYQWTRRAPQNKFGEAIWFSRPAGKDAEGKAKYLTLIKFAKAVDAEPVAPRTAQAATGAARQLVDGRRGELYAVTPQPPASQLPPTPSPSAAEESRIARGEKNCNTVVEALKAGATLRDAAQAVDDGNGASLFWCVAKHLNTPAHIATDLAAKARVPGGSWAGAIMSLKTER